MISEYYLELQRLAHLRPFYGNSPRHKLDHFIEILQIYPIETLLDYGCGKGKLKTYVPKWVTVTEYDPAIKGKDRLPAGVFDCVAAIDVLEHIEHDYIEDVLESIRARTACYVYFTISLRPARKKLHDGRNAHILLRSRESWLDELSSNYKPVSILQGIDEVTFFGQKHGKTTPNLHRI